MTKRVQILGHDHDTANAFIGEEREITVDIDNWELRLHDGSTPGGWLIYNRDENDARYQARNVELDGLLNWEPNERGIVTRLGPGNYALRVVEVNTGQLTITNPTGYAGNYIIGFAADITEDQTVSGSWTFTAPIIATGGVIGNLVGNVTGNLTGNVTGNVVGNLTGNANGNHTGSFTGDVDVRGHTLLMDDETIQLSWLDADILAHITGEGVPVGTIVMFGAGTVPTNWSICDGTEGTPDLRDRFVIGSGGTYSTGSSGGSASHTHSISIDSGGAHSHTASAAGTAITIAQMPAHDHGNGVTNTDADLYCYGSKAAAPTTTESIDDNSSNGTLQGLTEEIGGGDTHTHTITVDSGGAHVHTGTTGAPSALPPYYALRYIMKVS